MEALIGLLITLFVFALIAGLIWWLIGMIPLKETFGQIVRVIFAVLCVLIAISFLLGYIPTAASWRR